MTRAAAWPTAGTRLLALLGWPVGHSRSPAMHNAALAHDGLDLVYVAVPTPPDRLEEVVGALGAVGAVGANVTVPHKQAVLAWCDRLTEEAARIGAVNTLAWGNDGLVGDNTDARGLEQDLRSVGVTGGPAVIVGSGGAARGAVVALERLGCDVTVAARRPEAAQRLVRELGAAAQTVSLADRGAVAATLAAAALVVNATPLGMHDETLPEPFMSLQEGQVAYDLVYAPPRTPFLTAAERGGAIAHNGLGMLVAQAALSYERWTGRGAPVDVMTLAVREGPGNF